LRRAREEGAVLLGLEEGLPVEVHQRAAAGAADPGVRAGLALPQRAAALAAVADDDGHACLPASSVAWERHRGGAMRWLATVVCGLALAGCGGSIDEQH